MWVPVLRKSAQEHGWTWLHHLHLCVILQQAGPPHGNVSEGLAHCNASVASKRTAIGLAIVGELQQAWDLVTAQMQQQDYTVQTAEEPREDSRRVPWAEAPGKIELARDIAFELIATLNGNKDWAGLAALLKQVRQLPAQPKRRLLATRELRGAEVSVAMYLHNDTAKALSLLLTPWPEGIPFEGSRRFDPVPVWSDVQHEILRRKLGRPLTVLDEIGLSRDRPPPAYLDGAGAD